MGTDTKTVESGRWMTAVDAVLGLYAVGLVLGAAVIATIHIPPLLIVVLPCLAFASDLLYLVIFPPPGGLPDTPPTQER